MRPPPPPKKAVVNYGLPKRYDPKGQEQRIARKLRKLAHVDLGGVKLHIWHSNGLIQGNVEVPNRQNGWSVATRTSIFDAVEEALDGKLVALGLSID